MLATLSSEWEEKLREEGLSMKRGTNRRVIVYSADPETFPTKYQKRDRRNRRRGKTVGACTVCGERILSTSGRYPKRFCSKSCANRSYYTRFSQKLALRK